MALGGSTSCPCPAYFRLSTLVPRAFFTPYFKRLSLRTSKFCENSVRARMAGVSFSTWCDVGWFGRELRALLGTRDQRSALSLSDGRRADGTGLRAAGVADGSRVARVSARRTARDVLWVSRLRSVGSGARAPVQSVESPARSLRAHHRPAADVASVALRVRAGHQRRRRGGDDRQRAVRAARRDHRAGVHLGRRPAAAHAVARDGHLRTAREGHDGTPPGRPGGAARHVSRTGVGADHRPSARSGRDRRRAHAHPLPRRRIRPRRARAHQLLGLQHAVVLRAGRALLHVPPVARRRARVQDDGPGPARRRPRGHPRRRLQPHGGRRSPRPDAVAPRHRQRDVLPARARPAVPLRRLHGHGQHAQHAVAPGSAAHDGQLAVLGRGDARRRIPVRSRGGACARAARRRSVVVVLRRHPAGPGDFPREAHRRALGRRRRRLPGRQLSAGLGRMERQVSRRRSSKLARRRRLAGTRDAARRQQRSLRPFGPPASREHQLRHGARRFHAGRPRLLQRQTQRDERREQPRRRVEQPQLELRRGRAHDRPGDPRSSRTAAAQSPPDAVRVTGRPDAERRRRARPQPGRQQQRVLPRQRALVDAVGSGTRRARVPGVRSGG